jgi:PAS domain S-box-containing protein
MTRFGRWLHDLPVHHKLMFAILAASTLTMVLAGLVLFLFLTTGSRRNFQHDAEALARIVSANCVGPVQFEDESAALEILGALSREERVVGAAITLPQGRAFASLGHVEERWRVTVASPQSRWPDDDILVLLVPVKLGDEHLGTFTMVTDFEPVRSQFIESYLLVFGLMFLGSSVVGYALTTRARLMITTPIRDLAHTTEMVARTQNFSIRAMRKTGGEIGQLTDAFNEMMRRIRLGEAVTREVQERRRVEEALRESEERFRTLFDNATIGLYRANRDNYFLMANQALIQMVGYDSFAELAGANLAGGLYANEGDRQHIQQCLEHIGMVSEAEVVWCRRDGSSITVRLSAKAIRDKEGDILHFEGFVEDITTRKVAEAELQRLHGELMDASRAAGMAEVATGVLHNVGNVLNSVNVSVTLLNEQVEASRLNSLRQAVALMAANLDRLGPFLAEDPKGRLIPDYLIRVTEHLAGEQSRWREELGQLKANCEHMREVVAMQQNHARVKGFIEPLNAQSLVEDALRMNLNSLEKDGVRLEREYGPVPPVLADKHKVLQILINLVRNAHFAVSQQPSGQREIRLRVFLNGTGRVKIQVRDNGIGIPPENMTRIFSHGFTTRPNGHGFGLHSGALAARELGGTLSAESAGTGQGATFTLELPVANAGN